MEQIEVENRFGPPTALGIHEIDAVHLTEPWRLLAGISAELISAHEIRLAGFVGGQLVAEAVTYGSPRGIMVRITLTGPGMRSDVWEQEMPAEASIGEMVRRFWHDPRGVEARPAGRTDRD